MPQRGAADGHHSMLPTPDPRVCQPTAHAHHLPLAVHPTTTIPATSHPLTAHAHHLERGAVPEALKAGEPRLAQGLRGSQGAQQLALLVIVVVQNVVPV